MPLSASDIVQQYGGSPPNTTTGTVGSTVQIEQATGTPQATDTPPSPPITGGAELLPRIDFAVKGVESGNRQVDDRGKVILSPAGAIGVSQLMPETAKSLGVDPYDEIQNREGGKQLLSQLYSKYNNWEQTLIAYNWGEGNTDKWIAAGANPSKLPAETRTYVPAVLSRLGFTPGADFVGRKNNLSPEEIINLWHEDKSRASTTPPAEDEEAQQTALLSMNAAPVDMSPEGQAETMSLLLGARNGLRDIVAGPIQATLEQVAPETAKAFTNRINEMDEPWQETFQQHPYAKLAGEIIGTGTGIAVAARLLRPAMQPLMMSTAVGAAIRSLPTALRAAGVGAALGATSFNKDPDNASRLGEAALGIGLGYMGHWLGRTIGQALKAVSDEQVLRGFLNQLKTNLSDLEPSLSGIKDAVVRRYKSLIGSRDRLYGMADTAGRVIQGYPTGLEQGGGISKVIGDAIKGNVGRDEATALVGSTAREMDRALGLPEQREQQELWQKQQEQYEKALAEWGKTSVSPLGRLSDLDASTVRSLSNQGVLPPMPTPPHPFQSVPIEASRMAEARRVINRARGRARDVATRTQLGILKQSLDDTARETARAAGVDVTEYEHRQAIADAFNKENIAPLQKALGGRTVQEAEEQITPAEMYNRVTALVKTNDRDTQKAFYNILGQEGREHARLAMMHDMLSRATDDLRGTVDPKKIARYVTDNRIGLQTLLGREEFERIAGVSKIAESMAQEYKSRGLRGLLAHHPWLASFAVIKGMEGNWHEAAMLGGSVIGMEVLRAGLQKMQTIPRIVGPLLPRAARTTVDSPELKRIMQSIDVAMNVAGRTVSRMVPQATGGEPVTTEGRLIGQLLP